MPGPGLTPLRRTPWPKISRMEVMPRPESWFDERYWRKDGTNKPSTGDWFHNANFASDGNLAVGNQISGAHPTTPLWVYHYFTADADNVGNITTVRQTVATTSPNYSRGLAFEHRYYGPTGTAYRIVGVDGRTENRGGAVDGARGAVIGYTNYSESNTSSAFGSRNYVSSAGGGTITTAVNVGCSNTVSAGTITALAQHATYNPNVTAPGSITTQYGFYAGILTTAGTNWAFYEAAGTPSYFIGTMTFGDVVKSDTDNTDDLGATTKRWKDLYLGGSLKDDTVSLTIANCKTAYDHSQVTHDYSYISTNDAATDVTAAELEELSDASETTLHSHAAAAHNILSASHGDTLADTVLRGDIVVGNATPKWSRLAKGTAGQFLKSNGTDAAWAAHGLTYSDIKRSDCVTMTNFVRTATDNIVGITAWGDGSPLYSQHVNVRNVQVTVLPDAFPMNYIIGTVTVDGIDSDGKGVQEVFTFNTAVNETQIGDVQFAIFTVIVIDADPASGTGFYSIGLGDKIGIQNYPLNATGDVVKISKNGVYYAAANYTVDVTNGTIADSNPIAADDFYTIWYRPYK